MNPSNSSLLYFKQYVTNYINTEHSIEILIGSIEHSDVFKYKLSNKIYNTFLTNFKKKYKYSYIKKFHYKIYTNNQTKLYYNLDKKQQFTILEQIPIISNLVKGNTFDFKYKCYLKKYYQQPITSKYKYDDEIIRKTISFNIYNLLYVNFSEIESIINNEIYYSIKIILPMKFYKKKEHLYKEFMKLLIFFK